MPSSTIWIIVAILVLLAIVLAIGIVAARKRRRAREAELRNKASAVRSNAEQDKPVVAEKEQRADQVKVEAERAEEEARAKAERARKLQAEADHAETEATDARVQHDSQVRQADTVDPDVRTDAEGDRIDKSGQRIVDNPGSSRVTGES